MRDLRAVTFSLHFSGFTVHGSRFTVHGSRFTVHGSRFTVHGWKKGSGTLGSLNTTTGSQVVYTATTNTGNNVLRAVDDAGGTSTAAIKQQ